MAGESREFLTDVGGVGGARIRTALYFYARERRSGPQHSPREDLVCKVRHVELYLSK
jgi:hypothetical protein